MKRGLVAIVASALTACSAAGQRPSTSSTAHDLVLPKELDTIEGRVPSRATLDSLLQAQHIPPAVSAAIVTAVRGVFDPRRLRTSQPYRLTRTMDGTFRGFQYDIDEDQYLNVLAPLGAAAPPASFEVTIINYPKEIVMDTAEADISKETPSLLAALDARHEGIQLGLLLADVFGGEVDFNSELQRGDRVQALFERIKRSGQPAGYGVIQGAILENAGRHLVAIRFNDADGKPGYYDETGRSLKRQFLRSPLPFEPRITSRFSTARLHPIYGDVRAHLGVDYGAPAGTRVNAVANGVVESAEWAGDAGRLVRLRHAGGYETLYMHLSGFAPGLRAGMRISQGDAIGFVGATGAATAPHLDYRIRKNGAYVNPIAELNRMPKGAPIPANLMADFIKVRNAVLPQLNAHAAGGQH